MKPTKIQLKLLRYYERFRAESLTVPDVIRICWRSWLALVVGAIFGYWVATAGMPVIGWLVIGMCGGAFLRDIGRFQVLFRTWPVLREVINWERVRELIQTHENAA
jgi:hypothetical protein